jgi:formate dehydrogenase major subunit
MADARRRQDPVAPAHFVQDRAAEGGGRQGTREIPAHSHQWKVEYEGGGEETRSNPWLAELQQDCFIEINPRTSADRGVRNGEYVWVSTPSGARLKVKAKVTESVGPDTCFIPFHFSGWWQGEDMLPYYPEGAAPIVRGEAVNTATTYGYDRVTMMQETKTTLCEVAKFQA